MIWPFKKNRFRMRQVEISYIFIAPFGFYGVSERGEVVRKSLGEWEYLSPAPSVEAAKMRARLALAHLYGFDAKPIEHTETVFARESKK